jgi:Transposase IS4
MRYYLQFSVNSVNTPAKAWRKIFTEWLLNKTVSYTNEYERHSSKEWTTVSKGDLMDFISVLFISDIQNRKDAPANWFSKLLALESPIMKQITTRKKIHTMLMYLHVCSLTGHPNVSNPDYSPVYNVREMLEYLEERYTKRFIPGKT